MLAETDQRLDRADRPSPVFDADQRAFYSRQFILPEIGLRGQSLLRDSRVLVVGAGGLGSPVLLYLAAAGVGTLGIVEFDTVDVSNLHRQILFEHDQAGTSKARAAAARIAGLNPFVRVEIEELRLRPANALAIVSRFDIVVDATDNFEARYLINDACLAARKPNVSASILRFEGQISTFAAAGGPCYRCLFPEPPPADLAPSCAEAGVLGILPGVIGCLQATEVVKLVTGIGDSLSGRLLTYDALAMRFRELLIDRDPGCVACSPGARLTTLGLAPKEDIADPLEDSIVEVSPAVLAAELRSGGKVILLDVRNPVERELARIGTEALIPVSELRHRMGELPRDVPLVCYCHKGARSRRAAWILQSEGFTDIRSLEGGIDAWSRSVDNEVPRY